MWRVTGGEVEKEENRWMDGVKGCLNVRGLTIQETEECVKDWRERRVEMEGGGIHDSELNKLYEIIKVVKNWICFTLEIDSSEG